MTESLTSPAPPVTTLTFAEAWDTWLAYRTCNARPLRASTLADYESIYRRHLGPHLAHAPLTELDGVAIARLTIALSRSGVHLKRLSNVLVPLRACLRWHYRIGSLPSDPIRWFEPSAPAADERRILTPREIERLLGELPSKHRPFVAFAAYVGTRAGEQRALTWSDLDLAAGTARIDKTYFRTTLQRSTKTGRDRLVPIRRISRSCSPSGAIAARRRRRASSSRAHRARRWTWMTSEPGSSCPPSSARVCRPACASTTCATPPRRCT